MGTTGAVAGTSILALIAAIYQTELKRWSPIGPLGLISASAALVMSLVGIWAEPHWQSAFWESLGICWVIAVAFPHLGLLSLAQLSSNGTGCEP